MRRTSIALIVPLALALAVGSCRRAESPAAATSDGPQLVVSVILDQMGATVLERWWPALDEDGALKTLAREGAYHHDVRYGYAGTYTAPGHAATYTGAAPIESGIGSNKRWDRARKKAVSIADDGVSEIHGRPGTFAGPGVLLAETVGDTLVRSTHGMGKVVSLSMKDRGAIMPGGHDATFVAWFDHHTKVFTSSSAYGRALPTWFERWRSANPVEARWGVWNVEKPEECMRLAGPDNGVGEGNYDGYGVTFPHDVRATSEPGESFLMDPASTELLLELAERAADELELGHDETPDLLAISISGTDYVGHTFGPHSWESLEHLRRADRALGKLLRSLRTRRRVAMLVTADHGVAPIPERPEFATKGPTRHDDETLLPLARAAAERTLGPGSWVEAFVQPFFYLSEAALQHPRRRELESAIVADLRRTPGVAYVTTVADARELRDAPTELERLVYGSATTRQGEIMLFTSEGTIIDEKVPRGFGTSHGSPWLYDRTVTVIAGGPGVAHVETREPLPQSAVATSLASLLRAPAPRTAALEVLPGIGR
jgi:hypothetical protein